MALAVGFFAGWDWLRIPALLATLPTLVWGWVLTAIVMRNRRRRIYRGVEEVDGRVVRPSVNAKMKPEQTLFVGGPLLTAIWIIAIGLVTGWVLLTVFGVFALLAAAAWTITASVIIMRNRRRRFHRGFDERSSFWDFLMGR